ncbi:MAG: hypothetical protein GY756_01470 [bacterium]|nr:hypothetical protein [bacterium]
MSSSDKAEISLKTDSMSLISTLGDTNVSAEIDASNDYVKIDAGSILLTGSQKIVLQVGESNITLDTDKITASIGTTSVEMTTTGLTVKSPKITNSVDTTFDIKAPQCVTIDSLQVKIE